MDTEGHSLSDRPCAETGNIWRALRWPKAGTGSLQWVSRWPRTETGPFGSQRLWSAAALLTRLLIDQNHLFCCIKFLTKPGNCDAYCLKLGPINELGPAVRHNIGWQAIEPEDME